MSGPSPIVAATASATQLAALLGISPRRVRELAEAGTLPNKDGRYPVADAVAAYCANLREVAAGRQGIGKDGTTLDLVQERAQLARAQRQSVQLKIARERGLLVDAREVKRGYFSMITAAVSRLRGLPSEARGRIPSLAIQDVEILEDLIADALHEIANSTEADA